MTRVDITSYLANCYALAARALQRILPEDSLLGGPLCDLLVAQPSSPTAGLRAALCLAACRTLGGLDEDALPAAAMVELHHSASGLERRTPSDPELTGNGADAVLLLALEPLLERYKSLGQELTLKVLQVIGRMARETAEGRLIETGWVRAGVWSLSDADYRGMVLKRSGWRGFVAPTRIGAIVAGANGEQLASLEQFAADLGFAFQIYDDVNDSLRSNPATAPTSSGEVRPTNHSLPLLHAIRSSSAEQRGRLERALAGHGDVGFIFERIRESGGNEYAQHVGRGYALRARAALDRTRASGLNSEHGRLLYGLVEFTAGKGY